MLAETVELLFSLPFWVAVLRIATPLILGTLGVLLCERAGVLNLGIEGIMVAGAFTGWLTVYQGGGLWAGVLVAAFIAVTSVVKPTVVPTVVPTALMHQNEAIATAAIVRVTKPLRPGLSSGIEASRNHGDLTLASMMQKTASAKSPWRKIMSDLPIAYLCVARR